MIHTPPTCAEWLRELIVGCGRGELAELERLYDATIRWIYPMACLVSVDYPSADRLTAGAYRRIWLESPGFDPASGCAVSWVFRQVRDECTAASTGGQT